MRNSGTRRTWCVETKYSKRRVSRSHALNYNFLKLNPANPTFFFLKKDNFIDGLLSKVDFLIYEYASKMSGVIIANERKSATAKT